MNPNKGLGFDKLEEKPLFEKISKSKHVEGLFVGGRLVVHVAVDFVGDSVGVSWRLGRVGMHGCG